MHKRKIGSSGVAGTGVIDTNATCFDKQLSRSATKISLTSSLEVL